MSSAFSPLATILTQNKLTENNFIDWKRNLDIVLTMEDHAYVFTTDRDSKCACLKLRPSVDGRGSNKPVTPVIVSESKIFLPY